MRWLPSQPRTNPSRGPRPSGTLSRDCSFSASRNAATAGLFNPLCAAFAGAELGKGDANVTLRNCPLHRNPLAGPFFKRLTVSVDRVISIHRPSASRHCILLGLRVRGCCARARARAGSRTVDQPRVPRPRGRTAPDRVRSPNRAFSAGWDDPPPNPLPARAGCSFRLGFAFSLRAWARAKHRWKRW